MVIVWFQMFSLKRQIQTELGILKEKSDVIQSLLSEVTKCLYNIDQVANRQVMGNRKMKHGEFLCPIHLI